MQIVPIHKMSCESLRKNLYICRLKSLGNNINLEKQYEYYITEEIGNEGGG